MGTIEAFLNKAGENIAAAESLVEGGLNAIAISRTYYALFYVVEALLACKKLSFSSHKAVIAAFGKEFCMTKIFDVKFHRAVLKAFEYRQDADYEPIAEFSKEEVEKYLTLTKEFLEAARGYLQKAK